MTADQEAESKLIVALDMPDAALAYDFWQRLAIPDAVCKIGLELLMAGGVGLVRKLASSGVSVFVDAKLFDIGNTVERATARVADLGAAFLTVHAQDRQTLEAAVRGRAGSAMKLLGITLLTSANPRDLSEQGITLASRDLVLQRAGFAADAGFDGVVSSAWEARDLKATFRERLALICPGIRPASEKGIAGDDQARTATPADGLRAGADYIVVGRPILRASDPSAAARAIIAEMATTLRELRASDLDGRVRLGHDNA